MPYIKRMLLCSAFLLVTSPSQAQHLQIQDTQTMQEIAFTEKSELDNWVIINDTVMGGRSRARIDIEKDHLVFEGYLSLENNGGFASVRRVYNNKTWLPSNPLQIKVMGDGRQYQFRLRTNRRMDGVAYVTSFQTTKGEEQSFTFELSDFTPQFRGRLVRGMPALSFSDISQMGFMLAEKAPGNFELQVFSIAQSQMQLASNAQ
jgi:monofunctional biosynthetic peptidoglycan transglycosylase